jgi:hypothetical protein
VVDKEVGRVNGSAPYGEHRRLKGVELTARGLDGFGMYNRPLSEEVRLPDFKESGKTAWPRPVPYVPIENWVARLPPPRALEEHMRAQVKRDQADRRRGG